MLPSGATSRYQAVLVSVNKSRLGPDPLRGFEITLTKPLSARVYRTERPSGVGAAATKPVSSSPGVRLTNFREATFKRYRLGRPLGPLSSNGAPRKRTALPSAVARMSPKLGNVLLAGRGSSLPESGQ